MSNSPPKTQQTTMLCKWRYQSSTPPKFEIPPKSRGLDETLSNCFHSPLCRRPCLECIAVLMLQIVTVSGRASTRLRYSQSPGRRVPNRSLTGASKWQSWRLSFVAEVTNEDHATQERCDRIFLHQWWILLPHFVHSANVATRKGSSPCASFHHIVFISFIWNQDPLF